MYLKKITLTFIILTFVYCERPKKEKNVLETSNFKTQIKGKKNKPLPTQKRPNPCLHHQLWWEDRKPAYS